MAFKQTGEFDFIKKITHNSIRKPDRILRSAGDDAAVFTTESGKANLITTDILIEDVHFLRDKINPKDLGYKAIAVNLSDIAAMGAEPENAFVSIGIPEKIDTGYIDDIFTGMNELFDQYKINLLGGDTSSSKSALILNIVLTGNALPCNILYRNTAEPGDIIFTTGSLGNSRAGLHLLLNNFRNENEFIDLINSHYRPYPYVNEGLFLAQCPGIHACIDVSDGLSSDLGHIAEESGTGFVLFSDKIPVTDQLKQFCSRFSFDYIDYAASGGEDYTLVFTVDKNTADAIGKSYYSKFNQHLFRIGEITEGKERCLVNHDGSKQILKSSGWDHFKSGV